MALRFAVTVSSMATCASPAAITSAWASRSERGSEEDTENTEPRAPVRPSRLVALVPEPRTLRSHSRHALEQGECTRAQARKDELLQQEWVLGFPWIPPTLTATVLLRWTRAFRTHWKMIRRRFRRTLCVAQWGTEGRFAVLSSELEEACPSFEATAVPANAVKSVQRICSDTESSVEPIPVQHYVVTSITDIRAQRRWPRGSPEKFAEGVVISEHPSCGRLPRGAVPRNGEKDELCARFDKFGAGQWAELLEEAQHSVTSFHNRIQLRTQWNGADGSVAKCESGRSVTCTSVPHRCKISTMCRGDFHRMQSKRPQVETRAVPQEVHDFQPDTGFLGYEKFFSGYKKLFLTFSEVKKGLINCFIVLDILEGQKRQGSSTVGDPKAAPKAGQTTEKAKK